MTVHALGVAGASLILADEVPGTAFALTQVALLIAQLTALAYPWSSSRG